jgi:hypothetical protein
MEKRRRSTSLMKANLTEVALSDCSRLYESLRLSKISENVKTTQMCAKNSTNKLIDTCQGEKSLSMMMLKFD